MYLTFLSLRARKNARMGLNATQLAEQHEYLLEVVREVLANVSNALRNAFGSDSRRAAKINWLGFLHAVRWNEPWIVALMLFHVACYVAIVRLGRRQLAQVGFFLFLAALTFSTERINGFCAKRWKAFATQNYFDKRGAFASVMLSGPAMVNLVVVLINLLRMMVELLVNAKRAELRHRARESKKQR